MPILKNIARAIIKPPKVYFYDDGDIIGDEGARFEKLVATHLMKRIHFMTDYTGHEYGLNYIRDKEGREVDFAVIKNGKPEMLVEVEYGDDEISRPLKYYGESLRPRKAVQIVARLKRAYSLHGIDVVGTHEFFGAGSKYFP